MSNTTTHRFRSINDIRDANRRAGHHWFDASTLRFFNTRIDNELYGGRFFVTSEQSPIEGYEQRLYTVRRANDDATIGTVGEFQAYSTLQDARDAAQAAADAEAN